MAGMMKALRFDEVRMACASLLVSTRLSLRIIGHKSGHLFREAHHITGSAVALAEGKNPLARSPAA